jgi:hypothetical protein
MTTPLRRAQLMRYAPWVARDYLSNQGPSTALVVLLIAFLSLQSANSAGLALREMSAEVQQRILRQLVASLAFLGTFFATNGIVANDRKQGYYKFLFSKPVAPPLYYAMIFAVYGAGLLVVTAALLGLWAVTVHPVLPSMLFPVVTLMYVAYGGIGIAGGQRWMGALGRHDWGAVRAAAPPATRASRRPGLRSHPARDVVAVSLAERGVAGRLWFRMFPARHAGHPQTSTGPELSRSRPASIPESS